MKKANNRENPTDEQIKSLNKHITSKEELFKVVYFAKDNVVYVDPEGRYGGRKATYDIDLGFALGKNTAIMYNTLFNKFLYYLETDQLNDLGEFYMSVSDVTEANLLTRYEQEQALITLEENNLLLYRNIPVGKSLRPVRHFTLNLDFSVLDKIIIDSYNSRHGKNLPYRYEKLNAGKVIHANFTPMQNCVN